MTNFIMLQRVSPGVLVLMLFSFVCVAQLPRARDASLNFLVESERRFARASVEKGVRDSFLEFFAEDCISFGPAPALAKERILKRPVPSIRPRVTLNWEPIYGDISMAGDMGYTTGPYTLTNEGGKQTSPSHGYYFSVWQKQANGEWKVALDIGIETPAPTPGSSVFRAAPETKAYRARLPINQAEEENGLLRVERDFYQKASTDGASKAYLHYLASDARLHRPNRLPFAGIDAIRAFLSTRTIYLTGKPMGAKVAASGDLGFVYGSYEGKDAGKGAAPGKGYYARVWKRDSAGKWKLVADISVPQS